MDSKDLFSLKGSVALVTGASSGIGHTLSKGLAKAGAIVIIAARRTWRLEKLHHEIEKDGGKALTVEMDVTDKNSVTSAFDKAEKKVGVVDIIVNNAGVAAPGYFMKTDDRSLDYVMNTNFKGVWHVSQAGATRMVDAGRTGSIINISSILGLSAQPGQTTYSASKGAVIQLTRSMAIDLMSYNIRVNAIAPGWFKTEMNSAYFDSLKGQAYIERMPAKRLGRLEELVGPVIFLASQAGSFVNGSVIPVDGAIHTRLM